MNTLLTLSYASDLNNRLIEAATLDLVIVLDCTSSMKSYIAAAKENIAKFGDNIRSTIMPLRIAVVGYRDV